MFKFRLKEQSQYACGSMRSSVKSVQYIAYISWENGKPDPLGHIGSRSNFNEKKIEGE